MLSSPLPSPLTSLSGPEHLRPVLSPGGCAVATGSLLRCVGSAWPGQSLRTCAPTLTPSRRVSSSFSSLWARASPSSAPSMRECCSGTGSQCSQNVGTECSRTEPSHELCRKLSRACSNNPSSAYRNSALTSRCSSPECSLLPGSCSPAVLCAFSARATMTWQSQSSLSTLCFAVSGQSAHSVLSALCSGCGWPAQSRKLAPSGFAFSVFGTTCTAQQSSSS